MNTADKKSYHAQWYQTNKHLYKTPKRDSTHQCYWHQKLYSVWNNFTDEVVIIDGNHIECSKAMGISVNSFYTLVTKARQGKSKKWTILSRKIQKEERA